MKFAFICVQLPDDNVFITYVCQVAIQLRVHWDHPQVPQLDHAYFQPLTMPTLAHRFDDLLHDSGK